jgi:hypothetical protein
MAFLRYTAACTWTNARVGAHTNGIDWGEVLSGIADALNALADRFEALDARVDALDNGNGTTKRVKRTPARNGKRRATPSQTRAVFPPTLRTSSLPWATLSATGAGCFP